jgi:pimeloyl-ACP methyl ester carboxylesterase
VSNLSDRARWALDTAFSRAGSALDQGVLRYIRLAMATPRRGSAAVSRAARAGGSARLQQAGFTSPAAVAGDPRARLLEIAEHYRAAEDALFAPPAPPEVSQEARPARAGADRVVELTYPSRYLPTWPAYRDEFASYAANLTARVRLYRGGATPRPVVVCLHGWGAGAGWLDERAFAVPYLLRIGLDVALFQLPFHGLRTPTAVRSGALFPGPNVVRTNEAFGQAVSDLRALALHLRAAGAPALGVLGMSLGGYTAALWAGLDDDLAFAAAIIPAVSLARLFWAHGAGSPARRRAERAGVTAELLEEAFAVHAPLRRPVRLAPERLLVAAARGDRITPPEQAELLWRHWGQPELCWVPGGHLTQLARGDAYRAFRRLVTNLGLVA